MLSKELPRRGRPWLGLGLGQAGTAAIARQGSRRSTGERQAKRALLQRSWQLELWLDRLDRFYCVR